MSLILLGLLVVVLDVIALGNILFSSMSVAGKLLWALIVLLLPVVGMLLYCERTGNPDAPAPVGAD